jgi:hypothetical protein
MRCHSLNNLFGKEMVRSAGTVHMCLRALRAGLYWHAHTLADIYIYIYIYIYICICICILYRHTHTHSCTHVQYIGTQSRRPPPTSYSKPKATRTHVHTAMPSLTRIRQPNSIHSRTSHTKPQTVRIHVHTAMPSLSCTHTKPQSFLDKLFSITYTIILDGDTKGARSAGNLDALELVFRLAKTADLHLEVRIRAVQTIQELLIANPLNVVACRRVKGFSQVCAYCEIRMYMTFLLTRHIYFVGNKACCEFHKSGWLQ